jgi:alpha-galactosidase
MGFAHSGSNRRSRSISSFVGFICLILFVVCLVSCGENRSPARPQTAKVELPSEIRVSVDAGSVQITTPAAQFTVLPNGYVKADLKGTSAPLTLDDPGKSNGSSAVISGKRVADFQLDLQSAKVSDAHGQLGARGKRVEIAGKSKSAPIGEALVVEAYDDFPNLVLISNSFSNLGDSPVSIGVIDADRHRLNASFVDSKVAPYDMWSFEGASIRWGKDDIFEVPKSFSQKNQMGTLVDVKGDLGRVGGGIPVVAFWTRSVGEAIGHVETLPLALAIPVDTAADGRVNASVQIEANQTLKHGEQYTTPHTFLAVYSGDFYEPLHMYSQVISAEGLKQPKTTNEDYAVSWCGWGYLSDVTPKQMLDTIPKLKELGIHWATLDDRWFNNYGDWQPRVDTFPGDSIQNMVKRFHEQGIKVQLWWLPLAVEDGGPGYEDHKYGVSEIVKEHPDWLILDKNGKPARMTRNLAALCPAVPGVQAYYKQLTKRFIHDWGFDGSKLDNIYSVPMCFNPKHHHKSPLDSVYAMGEVYKTIFETTRALKPESVTQSCPCGTPPSIAWLRYLDQAVTADPVGSVQVRRRIKMYKALLGPESAVYGDHVELTHVADVNGNERDTGQDFASTLGTGGVLGTKFTWPDDAPKYKDVFLTPEKEAHWKKWIGLYNEKMLSRGTFLNLYVYGYDVPEGYAIEKDGAMYYAFFAPATSVQLDSPPSKEWSGEIDLRGLTPGKYHVVDYVNGKDFGTVMAADARLKVTFEDHLLLEATKE